MRRFLFLSLIISFASLNLSSCSTLGAYFDSPSRQYRSYVERKVSEAELFDRARLMLRVRALMANEALKSEQEKLSPGHSIELNKHATQLLVGIEISGREALQIDELGFFLDERKAVSVKEISHSGVIEQHYPFAFPYLRLFLVDFDVFDLAGKSLSLKVQTRVGSLKLSIKQ